MSSVWETRRRLLVEYLEALADQVSSADPALAEQTVRLLAAAVVLLRQHRINKRGQCRFCTAPRWIWHRRPQCAVYRGIDFAMRQPLDVVLATLDRSLDVQLGDGGPR